jgi:hypothetical protein
MVRILCHIAPAKDKAICLFTGGYLQAETAGWCPPAPLKDSRNWLEIKLTRIDLRPNLPAWIASNVHLSFAADVVPLLMLN